MHCRQALLTALVILGSLPRSAGSEEDLKPVIKVPARFGERSCESGWSAADRYRGQFLGGWITCLEESVAKQECTVGRGNGWASAVQGYADGYEAAKQRFAALSKSIGLAPAREAASAYLKRRRSETTPNSPNVCAEK